MAVSFGRGTGATDSTNTGAPIVAMTWRATATLGGRCTRFSDMPVRKSVTFSRKLYALAWAWWYLISTPDTWTSVLIEPWYEEDEE